MRTLAIVAMFIISSTTFIRPVAAATNLECMNAEYSPDQQKVIDQYIANFNFEKDVELDIGNLFSLVSFRSGQCAERFGWSANAASIAVMYQMTLIRRNAVESKTVLTPQQMVRLRSGLASVDQTRLRKIFEPVVEASINGGVASDFSKADSIFLGFVISGAGIQIDQRTGPSIGQWLGSEMGAQILAEHFAQN